ncbi:MAG: TRAP transporter fused permease subunit [Rhodospirillaceae bacterium]
MTRTPDTTAAKFAAGPDTDRGEETTIREPLDPACRRIVSVLGALLSLTCLSWAVDLHTTLGFAFHNEQFLSTVLGLAIAIAFTAVSVRRTPHRTLCIPDLVLGAIGLGACLWIALSYPRLMLDVAYRTPEIVTLAVLVFVLVLETLRRCTGWTLLIVVLLFVGYASVAHLMPIDLRGKAQAADALVVYLSFDPSAVFGSPLLIGTTVVIMFIWMGETLIRSGGGEFFRDVALAAMGRRRGGPAKICVVGSALFGTISGSAVSNVASIGVFTIPMMKRSGYTARDAGAIEAVGSTGGQLMPPVMGAAAFLMAEFLEIAYAEVALAATIPAVLYYWGLYCQVDLIAGRGRMQRLTDTIPEILSVLKDGWHFILPFVALMFTIFHFEQSPELSAIVATVCIFVTGMVRSYRGHRLKPSDFFATLSATGRTTTDLFITLAAAGFVIGILNATGLGFALTLFLVKLAGESMFILLVMAGFVSIILGMGMPTTAVYVLLAALIAPSIVEAGVPKLATHMFILYYGMLSMITPPVALAAFAAANISKAGPMETAWAACRIGWAKFVIPFMFVMSPTLLMQGSAYAVAWDAVTAFIGVYYVTVGLVGFFRRDMGPVQRVIVGICGLAAIFPDASIGIAVPGSVSLVALVIGGAVLALDIVGEKRARRVGGATAA